MTSPLTIGVQQQISETADATGTAVFSFAQPPPQTAQVVSIQVSSIDCSVTAMVGTTFLGAWQGIQPGGPFSVSATDPLLVTATNLTPGSTYTCSVQGYQTAAQNVSGIAPQAAAGASQATRSQQIISTSSMTVGQGALTVPVTISPNWRSLYVGLYDAGAALFGLPLQQLPPGPAFTVRGVQSGFLYGYFPVLYSPPDASGNPLFWRYPVWSGLDEVVNVQFLQSVGPSQCYIGADNDPTDIALDTNTAFPVSTALVRPDGYSYPRNSRSASPAAIGTPVTGSVVVAAPGAGFGLMIGSIEVLCGIPNGAGLAVADVAGTIGGVTAILATATSAASGSTNPVAIYGDRVVWPAGVLLDGNTALVLNSAGTGPTAGNVRVRVLYDVVPESPSLHPH